MAGSQADFQVRELSASTIRLIGSGQVITSVFSVVKELFENSVDASSTNVDIKLDDFGLERIEVCDNGKGVKKSDVPFMTKRHYTSKLSGMESFLTLETYGFRGEALASLCSVSDVTVVTKTKEDDVSTSYLFDEEGNIKSSKHSHLGTGTTVTSRHLFRNLPVRKQYYKTSQRKKEDLRKIEDLLIVFSIIKPNLRIKLRHGSDVVFQKLPLPDTKSVLHTVLGRHVANQLVYREQSLAELQGSVLAFLPKPGAEVKAMSRASSDKTYIVVNDRPVHVKELIRLLKRYYVNCHACDSARFPVCYVSIKLPIPDVDVNLDPNKSTILMRPMSEVSNTLEEILLQVYGPLDNVPSWHYAEASGCKTSEKNENSTKGLLIDLQNNNIKISNSKTTKEVPLSENVQEEIKINLATDEYAHEDKNTVTAYEKSTDLNVSSQLKPMETNTDDKDTNEEFVTNDATNEEFVTNDDLLLLEASEDNLFQSLDKDNCAVTNSNSIGTRLEESVDAGKSLASSFNVIDSGSGKDTLESSLSDAGQWSRGSLLVDKSGETIQPVELLAPTSKHTPGKRPLSPTSKELGNPPLKHRSAPSVSWDPPHDQPTLPGMINSSIIQASSAGSSHQVEMSNIEMGKGPRIQNTRAMESERNNKLYKVCARDQVAAQASQSQAEKLKKSLRQRLYHAEKKLLCSMSCLNKALVEKEQGHDRVISHTPFVVGQANLCNAWFCSLGSRLGVLNIHRLKESTLYQKLRAKHKLHASSLEEPIPLDSRNLNQSQLGELEKLGQECRAQDTFEITDKRLGDNGFDVKCFYDSNGIFTSELYGVCNLIPTYSVKDLAEVLDQLIKDPSSDLASVRPTKVLYYLQGEAARMAQGNSSLNSRQEAQEMLDQLKVEQLKTEKCFHLKPVFIDLFDLTDVSPSNVP